MLDMLQGLQSRAVTVRGQRSERMQRDGCVERAADGLFAVASATGSPAEAELAARAAVEILRRSHAPGPLGDRVLTLEEAFGSIESVLAGDAAERGMAPAEMALIAALVGDGRLAAIRRGSGALYLYRGGRLYDLFGAGAPAPLGDGFERRVTTLRGEDRILLVGPALARAIDAGHLAAELTIGDLHVVDRLAEGGTRDGDASAVVVTLAAEA